MDYRAYRLPDGGHRFQCWKGKRLQRVEEYGPDVDPEKAAVEFKRLCLADEEQRRAAPVSVTVRALG